MLGFRIDPYEKLKEIVKELQTLHRVRYLHARNYCIHNDTGIH